MSTLTFHEGRPRLTSPDLPPTLTPNPIHAMAKAPSRLLSSLGSLLVYGVFAVGSVVLARNVHTETGRSPVTGREVVLDLRPTDEVAPPLPTPPPPDRLLSPSVVATRPKDWQAPDTSNTIPEVTPTSVPTQDQTFAGRYTENMPVAKDPGSVTPPHLLPPQPVGGMTSSRTVDFDYRQLRVLRQASVNYPPLARLAKVQGPVEMLITIDSGGVPSHVEVLSGLPQLHAEAMRSAREWRFEPARIDGQPVSARFRLTINFRLQ